MMLSLSKSISLGARSSGPFIVSTFLFGLMFGISAASAGFSQWMTLFMSAAVFTATVQFAVVEFWQTPLPLVTILLSAALVSSRHILLGMALTHHLDGHSLLRRMTWLFFLSDPGAIMTLKLKGNVDRLGFLLGSGLSLYASWIISTWFGYVFAAQFSHDYLSSLGFAGPLVLMTMMMLFVKAGENNYFPWLASGVTAFILHKAAVSVYVIFPFAVLAGVFVSIAIAVVKRRQNDAR